MEDHVAHWHRLTVAEAARHLGTDPAGGLTQAEAERRLATHGPNRLAEAPPVPRWRLLLRQFENVLTLLLLAAAGLAWLIGDVLDAVIILAVVGFNAGLGFYQEHRAERILESLKKMLAPRAAVRRDGVLREVDSAALVPGDLVALETGDRVPADGRLAEVQGLEIDEASLTGESLAVAKQVDALDAEAPPLGERTNLAFGNTVVTRGRGLLLVTATGAASEMGRLVGLLAATADEPTPLQRKLAQLAKALAALAVGVTALILAMGLVRGEPLADLVLTAVALAVAAVPEGLPAVVTVTLAIGMYAMTRRGAIVKRLAAVETLGCTTVICSDKTGTLTLNRMTARAVLCGDRLFEAEGLRAEGALVPLLRAGVLCNDAQLRDGTLIGDPTEGALLALAADAGLADPGMPRLAELPFESETRMMATAHAEGEQALICVKGAPDALFARCRLSADQRRALDERVEALGERALRVLALAEKRVPAAGLRLADELHGLTLLGLVGIMDPPRAEVRAAIAECRRAGIVVKMITGDHKVTAAAIAREIGIDGGAVTGAELDALDEAALDAAIGDIAVFARVAPEHKVRIVRALKRAGHVVAMTGDGVNDAPALKAADIGVAMGGGTEVAREAAAMVLTDDSFATIVGAVRQGRTIYDNIVKFLRFQLSTNVGALLAVFAAPFADLPVPFTPIQILWVNIIMDGPPAMALAFDPPRPRVMDDPPRPPDESILGWRRVARLFAYGATMAAGTLAAMAVAAHPADDPSHARTLAFTTFVLFQFFNVFNARVGRDTALGRVALRNGKLWLALGAVLALQILAVHWPPAQAVFDTRPLSPTDWLAAFAVASSVLVLDEGRKLVRRLIG